MLKTNIVLQRDNIENIPKLYLFFKKIGRVRITINTLVRPKSLSVEYIDLQEKKRLLLLYQMFIKKISQEFPEVKKDLSFITDILQKSDISQKEQ